MGLRCLIVDDNEDFLEATSRVLESQGLEVVGCASSGDEAMRMVEDLSPTVALVDVRLGREDGVELATRLAAKAPATQVVLISTTMDDAVLELMTNSRVAGFLPKAALSAAAVGALVS